MTGIAVNLVNKVVILLMLGAVGILIVRVKPSSAEFQNYVVRLIYINYKFKNRKRSTNL